MKKINMVERFKEDGYYWLIVALLVILPFFITVLYSVPSADDFCMTTEQIRNGNILIESIKMANDQYLTHDGGWFHVLIQYLFNPVSYASPSSHLDGIVLELFFVLFLLVLFIYLNCVTKYIFCVDDNKVTHILFVLFLFMFFNTAIYHDILYWFVGNTYMRGATIAILSLVFTIKYFRCGKKTHNYVLSCSIGFIACMSTLHAIFVGLSYLMELWDEYSDKKRLEIKDVIPLLCMVAGGLVYVLAPGNYVRVGEAKTTVHFSDIITSTFQTSIDALLSLIKSPLLLSMVFCFIILGFTFRTKMKKRFFNPVMMWVVGFPLVYAVVFQVAYGYNGVEWSSLPNRIIFVVNLYLTLWVILTALHTGAYLYDFLKTKNYQLPLKEVVLCLILFIGIISFQPINRDGELRIEQYPLIKTASNVQAIIDETRYARNFLREIESSDSPNTIVHWNYYQVTYIPKLPELSAVASEWENRCMAEYYGKESLIGYFPDEVIYPDWFKNQCSCDGCNI